MKMLHFPGDPKKKIQWIRSMRGAKWTPTNHAKLFKDHFQKTDPFFVKGKDLNDQTGYNA